MLAIPTDPKAARAMLDAQTAEIEAANARLRPRTSRLSQEAVERLRVEASQAIPMPAISPTKKPQSLARRLLSVAYVAFLAGGQEVAK